MRRDIHPSVIVFCDHLLYPSETFIRAQTQALRRFVPVYAGSRRVHGLDLPAPDTFTINGGGLTGRARELIFKVFGAAPALTRKLRGRSPVLMHAHFGPDGLYALPLAKKLGIPLIVTFHGSDATATDLRHVKAPYGYRRFLTQKKILQREATLFLAVSEFIRKKLEEQGFPSEKVIVHHIGVDTALFSPADREKESIVLFVGRLVERKGVDYLIRAMADVQKKNSESRVNSHWRRTSARRAGKSGQSNLASISILGDPAPGSCARMDGSRGCVLRSKRTDNFRRRRGFRNGICGSSGDWNAGCKLCVRWYW